MSKRDETMQPVSFTAYGEPASKANSRRAVMHGRTPRFIKSKKALEYSSEFITQCPRLRPLITADVHVVMTIYYKTRRPDLDESLILDLMQDRIYKNDRQVKKKTITWGLDRENPRAEIEILPLRKRE